MSISQHAPANPEHHGTVPGDQCFKSGLVTLVRKSLEKLCVRRTDQRSLVHQSTEPAGRKVIRRLRDGFPF